MVRSFFTLFLSIAVLVPTWVSAHEVYVLEREVVKEAMARSSQNPFIAYTGNETLFFFWGFVALLTVLTIFFMSLFHIFERRMEPLLHALKRYAHLILRVTLGLAVLEFGLNGALYGPELPLRDVFGPFALVVRLLLFAVGASILLGWHTRLMALGTLLVYLLSLLLAGPYVLTYLSYGALCITLILMGGGLYSLDRRDGREEAPAELLRYKPLSFLIVRVGFGFSVLAAAVFAKFWHSNLALMVVEEYQLTTFFPFDPLFVVLGALIIESLIGLFIMLGVEIRWTAIFFLFWLILSLFYFGEALWPHLALFGLNVALIAHGYDRYSLEGKFFKRRVHEPMW
jgi:hypothetical protein